MTAVWWKGGGESVLAAAEADALGLMMIGAVV